MTATAVSLSTSSSCAPSFLYLRGRIFYYRRRLPRYLVNLGAPREIRICLCTSYQAIASKLARRLHTLTDIYLEKWKMSESNDVPDIWGQIEAVRERLRREVTSILSEKQKTPIGINELQDRMALYMRRKLDEDMALTDLPPVAEFHSPGQPIEKITLPETFREEADRLQLELMTGDNYDDNFHRAITELVHQNILKTSEISEENAQMIVKAFMIMQIKLFQILSATVCLH